MDKEEAKLKVDKLVKEFLGFSREELAKMKEEQVKFRFIEPLLEALGWEKADVNKEEKVLKGRADYILRIGNSQKLVIEAKNTECKLEEEDGRQAVSYAYHKNINFAVLTNFKQLRIYHALSNIRNIDKNLLKDEKGLLWINCEDFIKDFDRLWILSKESLESEKIDKLLENVDKRLIKPIDESILTDLLQYREWLSKDLKSKRLYLSDPQLDEIVQILIDRLIFMRSVEDRGLEEQDFLLNKLDDVQKGRTDNTLWALLKIQFKIFDKEYNSKLFSEGILEKEGFFDEKILVKVIRGLYYGTQNHQERYRFDDIPVDLLGRIYEQYLGVVLTGTEKRVKLDLASGKRKKMGIFYTPKYIVDYVLDNTVVEYARDKTLDEILNMKVVDPACGSGSFLLDAFEELKKIVEDRLKKGEKSKDFPTFNKYEVRLNLAQKATILSRCIYGVDLDEKAVELTQLNLLLKILEEETRETRKRLLPTMKDNIKNGNSLIDDLRVTDHAFKWEAQFPEVFKQGGFDIAIGNPPYVESRDIKDNEWTYYRNNYSSAHKRFDLSVLFFERGIKILKNNGFLGFISSNKFTSSDYGYGLRSFILDNSKILRLVDVSHIDVFKSASTYPYIFFFKRSVSREENDKNKIEIIKIDSEEELGGKKPFFISQSTFRESENFNFSIDLDGSNLDIINRIKENSTPLGSLCEMKDGIHTGNIRQKIILDKMENKNCKKLITAESIDRYSINWTGLWVNYDKSIINKNKKEYASFRDQRLFEAEEKLMTSLFGLRPEVSFDDSKLYANNSVKIILPLKELNLKFLMAILNSKIILFYYKKLFVSTHVRGGYIQFYPQDFLKIPIKLPSKKQEEVIIGLVDQMLDLQKKFNKENLTGNEKERLEQQIKNIDYEIDQEVYKLYGITPEEQKIIEDSLK